MKRGVIPPTPKGERHPRALFTNRQVAEIRREFLVHPASFRALAERYKCSHMTIWYLIRHVSYDES